MEYFLCISAKTYTYRHTKAEPTFQIQKRNLMFICFASRLLESFCHAKAWKKT